MYFDVTYGVHAVKFGNKASILQIIPVKAQTLFYKDVIMFSEHVPNDWSNEEAIKQYGYGLVDIK